MNEFCPVGGEGEKRRRCLGGFFGGNLRLIAAVLVMAFLPLFFSGGLRWHRRLVAFRSCHIQIEERRTPGPPPPHPPPDNGPEEMPCLQHSAVWLWRLPVTSRTGSEAKVQVQIVQDACFPVGEIRWACKAEARDRLVVVPEIEISLPNSVNIPAKLGVK